eukprot:jgi/Bigna1/49507/estExt_Genewise1.C_490098
MLSSKRGFASAEAAPATLKLALCQVLVGEDKKANIAAAKKAVDEASKKGAELIVLPEIWNGPYDTSCFPVYAETVPGKGASVSDSATEPSTSFLLSAAKENKVYLIGGSISEKGQDGKIYNTCIIVNPEGEIIGKHRKVHLFDIDVPGKMTFKESDTLSPGNTTTTFDAPFGKVGVGICYDIRFPELSMLMRREGASILIFPGAFNMTTGPAHWELLQRARAVDNQCYVAAASPARNPEASYQAWGHSTVVSPWGKVVATTDHNPSTVYAEIDLSEVEKMRENIPTSKQKRNDMYSLQGF